MKDPGFFFYGLYPEKVGVKAQDGKGSTEYKQYEKDLANNFSHRRPLTYPTNFSISGLIVEGLLP